MTIRSEVGLAVSLSEKLYSGLWLVISDHDASRYLFVVQKCSLFDWFTLFCFSYERPEGTPVLSCNFTFFDGAEDDEHDYEGMCVYVCVCACV